MHQKRIQTYRSLTEFESNRDSVDLGTPVYVDFNLGDGVTGAEVTQRLRDHGFTELYLCTGLARDDVGAMPWVRAVVDKHVPWVTGGKV